MKIFVDKVFDHARRAVCRKAFGRHLVLAGALALGCPTLPPQAHAQGGVALWTNLSNATGNGNDAAWALALDSRGNVVVTGQSYNGSNSAFATISYSSTGIPSWTNRYGGQATADVALAVKVDANDNVFVTGASSNDYATLAYSSAGAPLWTNRYNGPGNDVDKATRLAVDASGRILVTGNSWGGSSAYDYATISYSNAGAPLWTNRYNGPGNGGDLPYGLAVDSGGNVFVTGYSDGTNSKREYATLAYTSAGVPLWTNRYSDPANMAAEAHAVVVNNLGRVFVTGYSANTNLPSDYDYVTIAYASTGTPLWTNRYGGPAGGPDYALAAATDTNGDVYVTGYSRGTGSATDYATIKYSEAGAPLWTNRYHDPGTLLCQATAIGLDSGGNVFVAGSPATLAYSSSGVPLWTNVNYVSVKALSVDRDGNVLVAGNWTDINGHTDFATIKYSSSVRPFLSLVQTLDHQAVLSWNNPAFTLQAAPRLAAAFTNIPGATSPYTNATTAPQLYFRLEMDSPGALWK